MRVTGEAIQSTQLTQTNECYNFLIADNASAQRSSQEEAIQAEMMAALEPGSGKSDAEVSI